MIDGKETDFPGLPSCLVRESNNKAEFMSDQVVDVIEEAAPSPKVKVNGAAKPEKQAKPKAAKAKAAKPVKAKAKAKGSEKPKVAKSKAEKEKAPKHAVDAYGLRKGSAKSKAVAMYSRKSGATLNEVKEVVGSIQLNVLNTLEESGHVVEKKKEKKGDARAVFRYWLKPKA